MALSSKEYWKRREEEQLKHNITEEAAYSKELDRIYANMLDSVQTQIDSFYGKYADKEGITLAEAKKRVKNLDIEAYARKAKQYVATKDFSPKANEEMRLYNATMKINRLELLKAQIGLETIAGHDELEKYMESILQGRTMDELQRQAGILGEALGNNAKTASAIVNGSFHTGTFSDRIWQYQDMMRVDLEGILTTAMIQGKNPRAVAKDLRKYWYGNDPKTGGGARYCMERLMRTELARVQTEAQKQSFERNGYDEYIFIVNGGCCPLCEAAAKKDSGRGAGVYYVKDMMPGENAPPMHPNCRCSTAAHMNRAEYEAWLDSVANGGTTEEYHKTKAQNVNNSLTNKGANNGNIKLLADINKMLTPYERQVLDAVPKKAGYFDIAAHGAPNAIEYGSESMMLSARELARIIRHNEDYNGEKIRLLSCSTGSADDGFAQQLANALGVEVEAPSDILLVYPNGSYKIGYDNSGRMRTFKPYKKE